MKKSLPRQAHDGSYDLLPHFESGVIFCCTNPTASPWDRLEVKTSKKAKIVNCINCRGQFKLSWVDLTETVGGLHVGRLSEND